MSGHETNDQHRETDQPQQPGDQQRSLTGRTLRGADVIQRLLVLGEQTRSQRIEFSVSAWLPLSTCVGSSAASYAWMKLK
jgi:hypothetical protein